MSIKHKFFNVLPETTNWKNGFYTENGILKNDNLTPEILFLGTFNPDLESNPADIFYGRNFFWPAIKNIFVSRNTISLYDPRLEYCPYQPSLDEIFDLIRELKLTFVDLIESIFESSNSYSIIRKAGKEYVNYNAKEYNPIKDGDLEKLARKKVGQVKWNTENIIDFLNCNTQIKTIYFTRSGSGCWQEQLNEIKNRTRNRIVAKCIYTPSAQGGALHDQTGIHNEGKMKPLLRHWIHNSSTNYSTLKREWLEMHNVEINAF